MHTVGQSSGMVVFCTTITFLIIGSCTASSNVPISGYLTTDDKSLLKDFFELNLKDALKEPIKVYHVIMGLDSLGDQLKDKKSLCSSLKAMPKTPELAFYHAYGLKRLSLPDCKLRETKLPGLLGPTHSPLYEWDMCYLGALSISTDRLKELMKQVLSTTTPTIEDLYHSVMAMSEAGLEIDASAVVTLANKIKPKDFNPTTMGLLFQVVSRLKLSKEALESFVKDVPAVLERADEMNGKYLFFDKGLYTTSVVAKGIADLLAVHGDLSVISEDKLVKLINFLHLRLRSKNLRAAAHLIAAYKAFASNPSVTPVVIRSESRIAYAGDVHHEQTKLHVQLSNLWGTVMFGEDTIQLKAGSLFAVQGPKNVLTSVGPKEQGGFTAGSNSMHDLKLSGKDGSALPPAGLYELAISGKWIHADVKAKLLGLTNIQLPCRVLTDAKPVDAKITLRDSSSDQHVADIKLTVSERHRASTPDGVLRLDHNHQMTLSMRLVDSHDATASLTAHQVFVQLTHAETGQAITFLMNEVAAVGVSGAKAYTLNLEPEQHADEFDNLDGTYRMEMIVGDTLFRQPIMWHLADVRLEFEGAEGSNTAKRIATATDVSQQRSASAAALKRSGGGPSSLVGTGPASKAKSEIEHLFREPERRAPRPIAWAFTFACAVPLFGLLLGWAVLGINIWNFRFRLSNLFFHAGLIAIFALYYIYWCYLDMFTTLGYLLVLSIPTLLAGNRVLRAQLATRQALAVSLSEKRK